MNEIDEYSEEQINFRMRKSDAKIMARRWIFSDAKLIYPQVPEETVKDLQIKTLFQFYKATKNNINLNTSLGELEMIYKSKYMSEYIASQPSKAHEGETHIVMR